MNSRLRADRDPIDLTLSDAARARKTPNRLKVTVDEGAALGALVAALDAASTAGTFEIEVTQGSVMQQPVMQESVMQLSGPAMEGDRVDVD